MDDLEQRILARMSTALQALDDLEISNPSTIAAGACGEAISFNRLFSKAIVDERYRRELASAEAAKDLTE